MAYNFRDAANKLRTPIKGEERDVEVQTRTAAVSEMENAIDYVDMYDGFGELKIPITTYSRAPGSTYGIPYKPGVHRDENAPRILQRQRTAAVTFLRELRGFGLLADVVGSGKTYEAAVVLSELVYRGEVGSVLVVVPNELIAGWVKVLEMDFGMGKGSLTVIDKKRAAASGPDIIELGDGGQPLHPTILALDGLRGWVSDKNAGVAFAGRNLFDLIIVDEAHKLCEEGNQCVMSCLSRMLENGRDNGKKGYCLLLSATPHDGDFKTMFDLWYFIHTRGGDPHALGSDYERRCAEYIRDEWFGATNMSDFIRNRELQLFTAEVEGLTSEYRQALDAYNKANNAEVVFADLTNDWDRINNIDEFLGKDSAMKMKVEGLVADAYIGALRKIMVRQGKQDFKNEPLVSARKKAVNVYFYPTAKPVERIEGLQIDGMPFDINFSGLAPKGKLTEDMFPNCYFPAVERKEKGEDGKMRRRIQALDEFMTSDAFDSKLKWEKYATLMGNVLELMHSSSNAKFLNGYENYYASMLSNSEYVLPHSANMSTGTYNVVIPYMGDSYTNKMNALSAILQKHTKERVLIFFDYALDDNKAKRYGDGTVVASLYDRVQSALVAQLGEGKLLGDRLLLTLEGDKINEDIDEESAAANSPEANLYRFNDDKNSNCILLIKSAGYTHGANLQKASVIVNFQVSCDPIDMDQKIGRIFRLGQKNNVTIYSLADMHQLEGYALGYFNSIGLFDADNGDATILAGSNKSKMVTVRCSECGSVEMMPEDEYVTALDTLIVDRSDPKRLKRILSVNSTLTLAEVGYDSEHKDPQPMPIEKGSALYHALRKSKLVCHPSEDRHKGQYMMRTPIASKVFVCDANKDSHRFKRSINAEEGYLCMDSRAMPMCTKAGNDKRYTCDKLCAVYHCGMHRQVFPKCRLRIKPDGQKRTINELRQIICNVGDYVSIVDTMCSTCPDKNQCINGVFDNRCCPMGEATGESCAQCKYRTEGVCDVKPHVLEFNDKWETDCPIPGCSGKLAPQELSKFSDHIKYLWDASLSTDVFCKLLTDEANHVRVLKTILDRSAE